MLCVLRFLVGVVCTESGTCRTRMHNMVPYGTAVVLKVLMYHTYL